MLRLIGRQRRRWGTYTVPVVAVFLIIYGTLLLISSDAQYANRSYNVAFSLPGGRTMWGVAFILGGLAIFAIGGTVVATVIAVFLPLAWGATFIAGLITDDVQAPTAGLWPITCAASVIAGTARGGVWRREQ